MHSATLFRMARKRGKKPPAHAVRIPDDWWRRINELKPAGVSATAFVQQIILRNIDAERRETDGFCGQESQVLRLNYRIPIAYALTARCAVVLARSFTRSLASR